MVKLDKKFESDHGTAIYVIAVLALLAMLMLISIALQAISLTDNNKETLQTALNLLFQAANIAVFVTFICKIKARPQYFISPKISWISYAAGVVFGLVCIFCFVCFAEAGQRLLGKMGYEFSPPYVNGLPVQDFFMIVITVIAAPVCEELIYRSALLSGLKKKFGDIACSLLCGLAFALMHMNPEQTIYQFCLGFGASMLTISCGSVIPAMIMHATSNFVAVMDILKVGGFTHFFDWYEKVFASSNVVFAISTVGLAAVGTAIFVFAPRFIKKVEESRAQRLGIDLSQNKDFSGTTYQAHQVGFFAKNRTMVLYALGLLVCAFMWVSALLVGLN